MTTGPTKLHSNPVSSEIQQLNDNNRYKLNCIVILLTAGVSYYAVQFKCFGFHFLKIHKSNFNSQTLAKLFKLP